jgi:hypothetical protein
MAKTYKPVKQLLADFMKKINCQRQTVREFRSRLSFRVGKPLIGPADVAQPGTHRNRMGS